MYVSAKDVLAPVLKVLRSICLIVLSIDKIYSVLFYSLLTKLIIGRKDGLICAKVLEEGQDDIQLRSAPMAH